MEEKNARCAYLTFPSLVVNACQGPTPGAWRHFMDQLDVLTVMINERPIWLTFEPLNFRYLLNAS
jgi:hypothetical protein